MKSQATPNRSFPTRQFLLCALLLAIFGGAPLLSEDDRAQGVEHYEGVWKVSALGAAPAGSLVYVRFGAAQSLEWFEFDSSGACQQSRHQYRFVRDRFLVKPLLPAGRTWWNLKFETSNRIHLLERRTLEEDGKKKAGPGVRTRLTRDALPDYSGCSQTQSSRAPQN